MASCGALFTGLLLLLLLQVTMSSKEYTNIIELKQGRLRGVVRSPVHNGNLNNIHMYLGIPYAAPPVGQLRFMAPQSPQPWPGLMIADSFSPVCPQKLPNLDDDDFSKKMSKGRLQYYQALMPYLKNQSEDCLYLNIYTPLQDSSRTYRRHSVLVIIHGESYSFGSGNIYDGFVLASYANMVVVTFNFRLGILGYKIIRDVCKYVRFIYKIPQAAILTEWFHFQGSSGHKVSMDLWNPLLSPSYDLFKRAILLSGSALSLWSLVTHPLQYTLQVAQHFNCPETDPEMSICLRNKRLSDITAVDIESPRFKTAFGPIIDGNVIPNDPEQCMTVYRDIFSRYELMFGLTQSESYHQLDGISLLFGMKFEQTETLLRDFVYSKYEAHPDVALAKILQEYNNWNKSLAGMTPKSEAEQNRDNVLSILNDALYNAPVIQMGEYHAKANRETYFYVFGHKTDNGLFPYTDQSVSGEEVPYFLGVPLDGDLSYYKSKYTTREKLHSEVILTWVSNFARSGHSRSVSLVILPYWVLIGDLSHYKSKYTPREKLHSEVILTWVSNFARSGNPNMGMRDSFQFLSYSDWAPYLHLHWPPFDPNNQTYLQMNIPPRVSKHYKADKVRYWNVNLPHTLSQCLTPSGGIDKYASRYPSILREFPPNPEPDRDYAEPKYGRRPEPEPKPRDFDPRPWIEQPLPKPNEAREDFNPYDNFGTRPQFGRTEKSDPSDDENVKSSSISGILITLGVIFLLLNLFAFVFIFYQKNRLNMREHLFNNARIRHFQCTSRNTDGDDEYEFTDDEVESQIYMKKTSSAVITPPDVKSILKHNNSDYEAVSTNKQNYERKNSSSTVDANMKVRQWIVEKCNGETQFEMDGTSDDGGKAPKPGTARDFNQKENIYVDRKDRADVRKEGNYDVIKTRKTSNDSSSTKKQGVKKVSVAVDATPATRTASVLRQIPIEITKSSKSLNEISKDECEIPLVLRKNKSFDYPDDEFIDEKSRTLPSNFNKKRSMSTTSIHELKQLIDSNKTFQEVVTAKTKTLKKPKTVHKNEANILDDGKLSGKLNEDINVTSRDEKDILPLTHQQTMNGIMRRNFPKVLPEYPGIPAPLPALPIDVRRLSLPPNSFDLCSADNQGGGPKIPPLPPPRISSTLGRKPQQPLHKSQVFIQLNKNESVIPETIDESCAETLATSSGSTKDIENKIDKILQNPPKLTKQNSVDLESTIKQVKSNMAAIEHNVPNIEPTSSATTETPEVSRNSNSFESAIKKQKNKILNKLSSGSSGEKDQSKRDTAKERKNEHIAKETSPECINLSEENVFYETVFHDSSVTNVVPNPATSGAPSNPVTDIPFVHKQQNKSPEEIYKTLKMIRLEKEKLESSSPISTPTVPSTMSTATASLPINDKTSTYAIIRNTNQNPQQLLNSQQKTTKVSKEPKYIIKPQLSQITPKKVPVANTNSGTLPEVPSSTPRVLPNRNKPAGQGVQSNIMIGTQANIISGVPPGRSLPHKESVEPNYKVPYTKGSIGVNENGKNPPPETKNVQSKTNLPVSSTNSANSLSVTNSVNIPISSPPSSSSGVPHSTSASTNSTTQVPSNTVSQAKSIDTLSPTTHKDVISSNTQKSNVIHKNDAISPNTHKNNDISSNINDVISSNTHKNEVISSNTHKNDVISNKNVVTSPATQKIDVTGTSSSKDKKSSTETLSSDKSSNSATASGMSTIKRKKKS
ncbi:hypothetical protein M8J76_006916 [Diaphorina citri]|nr:hypothetical protein M8J76_006916 [Diaphorina citri]